MLLFAKKEDLYVRLQIQVVHIKALKLPLKKTKNKGRREKNAEIMKKRTKWGGGTKQNNNSHEFPISFSSFASEDFWYKEPWREKRIWIAEREVWRRGGKRERWGWGEEERDDENQISNRKTNSTNETATNSWVGVMARGSDLSWFGPSSLYLCMEMDEESRGNMEVL